MPGLVVVAIFCPDCMCVNCYYIFELFQMILNCY